MTADLPALLRQTKARVEAMTLEEKAEMIRQQAESYARAEASWPASKFHYETDLMPKRLLPPSDIEILRNALNLGQTVAWSEAAMLCDTALAYHEVKAEKDAAYRERNLVVSALAKCFPAGISKTDIPGWDSEWHGCVYIDLPTGQASWHYHDSEADLFAFLPPYRGQWDGHSTQQKYERLAQLATLPTAEPSAIPTGPFCVLCGSCHEWGEPCRSAIGQPAEPVQTHPAAAEPSEAQVEAVARAICTARGLKPDDCASGTGTIAYGQPPVIKCSIRVWETLKPEARAALAAASDWRDKRIEELEQQLHDLHAKTSCSIGVGQNLFVYGNWIAVTEVEKAKERIAELEAEMAMHIQGLSDQVAYEKDEAMHQKWADDTEIARLQARIAELEAENKRLHERLEDDHVFVLKDGDLVRQDVDPGTTPDRIFCQDVKIAAMQEDMAEDEAEIARLQAKVDELTRAEAYQCQRAIDWENQAARLKEALEPFVKEASERDGSERAAWRCLDENRLVESWITVGSFRRARAALSSAPPSPAAESEPAKQWDEPTLEAAKEALLRKAMERPKSPWWKGDVRDLLAALTLADLPAREAK